MRSALLTALFLALGFGSATASAVTFSTTASQLCYGAMGCGINFQSVGGTSGVTVTFNGVSNSTVAVPPSPNFAVLGDLTVTCNNVTGPCSADLGAVSLNLYIVISQTDPTTQSGTANGAFFSGSVSNSSSSATLNFGSNNSFTLGGITYNFSDPATGNPYTVPVAFSNPVQTAGGSSTTIYAQVSSPVPEPGSVLLSVAGLALIAARFKAKR